MEASQTKAGTGRRKYEKKIRAEREAQTRARIVDAALALLQEGGPAAVNVSAVARGAGVQRLTVYRHFPGGEGIVEACDVKQAEQYPPPDPAEWANVRDPSKRLRRALKRLYGYYRVSSDFFSHTAASQRPAGGAAFSHGHYLEGVVATLVAGWPARGKRGTLAEAAIEHAVRFRTWSSLCEDSGLSDKAATRLMVRMVEAAARKTG